MSKLRKALSIALSVAFLCSLSLPATATYADIPSTISYRDVKLKIDGIPYTPRVNGRIIEPFILNGTTYLPVRAVADAFGRQVEFDSSTNTVKLGAPQSVPLYSREHEGKNEDISTTLCYRDIKIEVEGILHTPTDLGGNVVEPFIIDGTTYLPIRAVGNALGVAVSWDSTTNTIYLGEQPSESSYSKANPAPFGVSQRVLAVAPDGTRYTARVTVHRAITGDEATSLIFSADIMNPAPSIGMRYGLARVSFALDRTSDGGPITIDPSDFDIYSSRYEPYADCFVTPPYPAFGGTIQPGQTLTGYIPYMVKESEQRPFLAFGTDDNGESGIWATLR